MENQEENNLNPPVCDPTTKHLAGTRPAGYSNSAYIACDSATQTWYWHDPQIALEE